MNGKNNRIRRKAELIYDTLMALYGPQKCCLEHNTPFQLLVATILSAQCTDKKVNSITPALFERWPDAKAFASCSQTELEDAIHVCGFFHAKAEHIRGAAKMLVDLYGGEVPQNMDALTKLPGVGRKTANVVLGDAFETPGLPVDTHVKRLTNLIGLADTDDPVRIEQFLCSILPPGKWAQFSHLLILHGRTRCPARRPDCAGCEISEFCDFMQKASSKTPQKMKTNAPKPRKKNNHE